MRSACHFTCGIKTGDRLLSANIDDFSVLSDTDTAHAVVHFWPDAGGIERSRFNFNGDIKRTAALGVFLSADITVEFFNLLNKRFFGNSVVVGEFSDRVEFLGCL